MYMHRGHHVRLPTRGVIGSGPRHLVAIARGRVCHCDARVLLMLVSRSRGAGSQSQGLTLQTTKTRTLTFQDQRCSDDNQDRRCSDDTDIDISRDNYERKLVLDVGC